MGDSELFRNAFGVSVLLAFGVGLLALDPVRVAAPPPRPAAPSAPRASAPPAASSAPESPRRAPLELTAEQRALGLGECSLPDPGLVYLAPARSVARGSFYIPAEGGMAADGGYDVIVHFHGGNAVKKTIARQARGVAFVGIDLGNGSGPYADAFPSARPFDDLRSSLESALRAHANDPRAHVRHLALSGWSAGYGAINAILRAGGGPAVDAVILLDGFHANLTPAGGVDGANITPLVAYARGAAGGERYFYFSHSRIATDGYASTSQVATYLLGLLGVRPVAATPTIDPLGLLAYADREGFHLRAFDGADARAHCDHTRHIAEAVAMLEERWRTPAAAHPDSQDRLAARGWITGFAGYKKPEPAG